MLVHNYQTLPSKPKMHTAAHRCLMPLPFLQSALLLLLCVVALSSCTPHHVVVEAVTPVPVTLNLSPDGWVLQNGYIQLHFNNSVGLTAIYGCFEGTVCKCTHTRCMTSISPLPCPK